VIKGSHGNPGVSLVTGGAGFIGSHVAAELLKQGHSVICVDDLSGGCPRNLPEGAEFVTGSIGDRALVGRLFSEKRIDYIFHLAAFASEGLSHFVREWTIRNNILAAGTLINEAVNAGGVKAFVFASSAAVYGKSPGLLSEEVIPWPIDPYGVSKLAVEHDLQAAADFFGLPIIVLRLHNVFGSRQNLGDPYRNVAAIFVRRLLENKPLPFYGDGHQTRQFSHVTEVARTMAHAIHIPEAYGQTFNLGADRMRSILELGMTLSAIAKKSFNPEFLPARNEANHPCCSHDRAREVFGGAGWDDGFETGLEEMWQWARETPINGNIKMIPPEIERGFPAHWR
jgi:UDP-glucose 4-epimerase